METCKPNNFKIALTLGYMILILATSIIPMDREIKYIQFMIDLKSIIQNLLHIPMFAVLSIFLLQISSSYLFKKWQRIVWVLIICTCFGMLNEIIQVFIPGRYAGMTDMILNIFGAILGITVYALVEKSKPGLIRKIICS